MRVLISGGGIAGIALAYFLQKEHAVTLVEKSSQWRTIGLGVGIWKNGLAILDTLPLDPKFKETAFPVYEGAGLSADGEILLRMSFETMGTSTHTFERDALHRALAALLDGPVVRFNTSVASITESESSAEVAFNDGTRESFDLVVGADGVRSNIRSLIFGPEGLRSYGWNIWGAWVPASVARFPGYHILCTAGESLLSFPHQGRHAIGLLLKSDGDAWPTRPKSKAELLEKFPKIRGQIEDIVSAIPDLETMPYDKLQYASLREWHRGRVVLIGDAKHGMSPLTGAGASFALEDALVLSQELARSPVPEALARFAARRDRRMRSVKPFQHIIETLGMIRSPLREKVGNYMLRHTPDILPDLVFGRMFNAKL